MNSEQFPPAGAERVKLLLAKELHREYRAAEKALNGPTQGNLKEVPLRRQIQDAEPGHRDKRGWLPIHPRILVEQSGQAGLRHDHGWDGCHKQEYFIKRAELVIKRAACRAPETLGEAEQALDATILIRRLMVEGQIPFPEADAGERSTDRFSRTVGDASKPFASGGFVTEKVPFVVGENSGVCTVTYRCLPSLNDAQRKALRDRMVHEALNPPIKYRVTNAIAGEGNGRGVR